MTQFVDKAGLAETLHKIKQYALKKAGKSYTYTNTVEATPSQFVNEADVRIAINKVKDYVDNLTPAQYITKILTNEGSETDILSSDESWIVANYFTVVFPKNFDSSDLALGYDGSKISVKLIKSSTNSNPECDNGQAYIVYIYGKGEQKGSITLFGVHNGVSASLGYSASIKEIASTDADINLYGETWTNTLIGDSSGTSSASSTRNKLYH